MATFAYTRPGEVDGDPREVRDQVLSTLERLARLVEDYSADAKRQLLNAGMSDAIEHGGGYDPLTVYANTRPKEHSLVDQLDARADQFARYNRVLRKAVAEYDADPDLGVEGVND